MLIVSRRKTNQAVLGFIGAMLLGVVASGCNKMGCTPIDVPSMMVSIVDQQGHHVEDPKLVVEFQHGPDKPWQLCNDETQHVDNVALPVWRCGGDIEGTFNVRATLGEMSGRTEGVRVKMADECHVETQDVEVVLQ